jgi:thiol-disulfide isomerase/thioredoxin
MKRVLFFMVCVFLAPAVFAEVVKPLPEKGVENKQIILKVVGPEGEALAGAKVYQSYSMLDGHQGGTEYICDGNGMASLAGQKIFNDDRPRDVLYGLYENKLAGFLDVNARDIGKKVEMKLTPACRVYGEIKSTDLNNMGQKLNGMQIDVGRYPAWYLSFSSEKEEFEFLLPEGAYVLEVYSGGTYSKHKDVKVVAGQKGMEINFDLRADRLKYLIGKEAPELQQIKGWINSEPIKLADLRDKTVLLDFWGTWCGPCVGGMPELMDLYEQYHDKGWVIIGIHDDSMNSIKELGKKIEELSKEYWNSRKIPFAIALDGGGYCKIEGSEFPARGATTAAYGIHSWPTMVLIKKGKVVYTGGGMPPFAYVGGSLPFNLSALKKSNMTAPVKATMPDPLDGATLHAGTYVKLNWQTVAGAALHKVYFGTSKEDLSLLADVNKPAELRLPDIKDAKYYWRVDEVLADGNIVTGDVWRFDMTGKLVGWWKFDETEGNTAVDSSDNGNDGILVGNPVWRPQGGKIGGALEFSGKGDYVKIANEHAFDITNQITISAWVNITSVPQEWTGIVTKGDTAWRMSTSFAKNVFHFGVGPNDYLNGMTEVSAGQWHHVACVYDGKRMRIYVDGVLDVSIRQTGPIATNDFPVCIGENIELTGRCWHGLIDDVRIYNYALSENKIASLAGLQVEPERPITIQVQTPDGRPIPNETVFCVGADSNVILKGTTIKSDGERLLTDANGRFAVKLGKENLVFVIANDKGFGMAYSFDLVNNPTIVVQPWGRIEGIRTNKGQPLANNSLRLRMDEDSLGLSADVNRMDISYCVQIKGEAMTDSQGRFVFEHVPPVGIILLEDRKIPSRSSITLVPRIRVKPGKTTNVEIKTQGRTVVGRLKLAPGLAADINIASCHSGLMSDRQSLSTFLRLAADSNATFYGWLEAGVNWHGKFNGPEMPKEFDTPEKRMKWWFDFYESDMGREWLKLFAERADFEFHSDGTFIGEMVEPREKYKLQGFVERKGEKIAMLDDVRIAVPLAKSRGDDKPFDMGEVLLKAAVNLKVGDAAPDFNVETLDGKPLNLFDFRGKYVLLDFWATWCGPCVTEMPNLKKTYEEFGQDKRFVMISLSVDSDRETTKKFVESKDIRWTQVFLGDWSKDTVTANYGVYSIPSIFLVGPDGKIMDDGLIGNEIKKAVSAALAKK